MAEINKESFYLTESGTPASIAKSNKQGCVCVGNEIIKQKKNRKSINDFRRPCQGIDATGFEPATSASRTQRSTKLSHASL